jgi:hypothetical protein
LHIPILWTGSLMAFVLLLALMGGTASGLEPEILGAADRDTLLRYARDTWSSLRAMADGSELPVDRLRHLGSGTWQPSATTRPPDIASYLWSILAAHRLKIIESDEAERRLDRTLTAIERLDRIHGLFVDVLDTRTGKASTRAPSNGRPIRPIISAVDNGWMATALIMIRNTYPKFRTRAEDLLKPMEFAFFYEPYDAADSARHPGQLREPFRVDEKTFGGFDRILNTEQRIASYIGIARGHIPAEHYYRVERTLKAGEGKQSQVPAGERRIYRGISVFEGHYTYRGMRLVPSWGGSMFEALMVTLFVPEERWAPRSWGVNHPLYVQAQIEHGLKEARYGYWGFSPASNPEGGYRTYGVEAIASDPVGYSSNNTDIPALLKDTGQARIFTNGIVTPHASFLALRFAPREALENLRKLKEAFPIYREYGFMDSVNVSNGVVADRVLALDQGMIMAAIANALADDAMRHAFSDGAFEAVIRPLIAPEEFTAGVEPNAADHGPG